MSLILSRFGNFVLSKFEKLKLSFNHDASVNDVFVLLTKISVTVKELFAVAWQYKVGLVVISVY